MDCQKRALPVKLQANDLPSMAMQRTTFSPRCCCSQVSTSKRANGFKHVGTYGNLEHKLLVVVGGLEGVQNRGQLGGVEFHCNRVSGRSDVVWELYLELPIESD